MLVCRFASAFAAFALTIRESYRQLEQSSGPDRLFLSRDTALPVFQIEDTSCGARGSSIKPERMVLAPLLPSSELVKSLHESTFRDALPFLL